MSRHARLAPAAALLGVVLLAGCTASSRPTTPSSSSAPGTSASSPAEVTGTPPIASSPSTPSSSAPSSPSGPTSSGASSSTVNQPPVSAPRSTCTSLTIRVLVGSGAPGYEFAALQFVNTGRTACRLVGVPTVTLKYKGKPAGTTSRPSRPSAVRKSYRLAPGATAESKLKDFSDCNAPLSDTITVVAPGSEISTTRPGQLRACTLVVYPLGKPE